MVCWQSNEIKAKKDYGCDDAYSANRGILQHQGHHYHNSITFLMNENYISLPTTFQKLKGRPASETGPLKPMKRLLPNHRFQH